MQAKDYMKRALKLAGRARGQTSPNPMVGAVIVKEGEIIGEGYHHAAGRPHAEIEALRDAEGSTSGATLYVTLEPCCHYGKTPPCTKALIESDIEEVHVAMEDPNPEVSGQGIEQLREAGITVEVGMCGEEAEKLNEPFIKYITTGRPFVVLKNALSLDGKIATRDLESKWISGKESRQLVHELRDELDAILVGVGTVLADNPRLTARAVENGRDPTRVILDSKLRTPLDSNVVTEKSPASTIIATTEQSKDNKREQFQKRGVKLIEAGETRINLLQLLSELGDREITSILVEGGSQVNTSFWEKELVDKMYYFLAPKIIGGDKALSAVEGQGAASPRESIKIVDKTVNQVGRDILVIGYPEYSEHTKG